MILKTKNELIETAAERIKKQCYRYHKGWPGPSIEWNPKKVYKQLIALDNPTEAEVVEIIGNASWTQNRCDECRNDVDITVMLGEEPDYESATAYICISCLEKALDLTQSA